MKHKFSEEQRTAAVTAIGLISVLVMSISFIFATDTRKAKGSSFESVITANMFQYIVVGMLGASVPMFLDLSVSTFLFRRKLHQSFYVPNTASRFLLSISIIIPSVCYITYSFSDNPRLISSIIISMIQDVLISTVFVIQLLSRRADIYSFWVTIPGFVCFTLGKVIFSVGLTLNGGEGRVLIYGALVWFIGAGTLLFLIAKHAYLYLSGRLDYLRTDWQTVVVGLLGLTTIFLISVSFFMGSSDNDAESVYGVSACRFLGQMILNIATAVLLNLVLTTEVSYTQIVTEEKLAMKRLFVRFISHEVRSKRLFLSHRNKYIVLYDRVSYVCFCDSFSYQLAAYAQNIAFFLILQVRTPLNGCLLGLNFMTKQFQVILKGTTNVASPQLFSLRRRSFSKR